MHNWDLSGASSNPKELNHSATLLPASSRFERASVRLICDRYKQTSSAYCKTLMSGLNCRNFSKSATYIEYRVGLKTHPWGRPFWACLIKSMSLNLKWTSLQEIRLKINLIKGGGNFSCISFGIRMSQSTLSKAPLTSRNKLYVFLLTYQLLHVVKCPNVE